MPYTARFDFTYTSFIQAYAHLTYMSCISLGTTVARNWYSIENWVGNFSLISVLLLAGGHMPLHSHSAQASASYSTMTAWQAFGLEDWPWTLTYKSQSAFHVTKAMSSSLGLMVAAHSPSCQCTNLKLCWECVPGSVTPHPKWWFDFDRGWVKI